MAETTREILTGTETVVLAEKTKILLGRECISGGDKYTIYKSPDKNLYIAAIDTRSGKLLASLEYPLSDGSTGCTIPVNPVVERKGGSEKEIPGEHAKTLTLKIFEIALQRAAKYNKL